MRLYLLLLAFTLSIPAFADASPCGLGTLFSAVEMSDPGLLPADQAAIERVLCGVAELAGQAGPIRLAIGTGQMAFTFPGQLALEARYQPSAARGLEFRQSPEISAGLWAHEYAHAVLASKLVARHPDWQQAYARNREYADLIEALNLCPRQTGGCPEFRALLERRRTFWQAGERERCEGFASVFYAYDELFADVVSVAYFGNAQAVANGLRFPGMSVVDEGKADLRDFSLNHRITDGLSDESHGMLAPVRSWLWQNRLNRSSDKAQLLRDLEVAIEAEVTTRLEAKEYALSPQTANERLIERLRGESK